MLEEITKSIYGKSIKKCSNEELLYALMELTKKEAQKKEIKNKKKKLYYFSAEFLIGKLLGNNLINLGIYEKIALELKKAGKNILDIEEFEPEPSLGNGGLGRLAACFLDSIATLNLFGDGVGICYHFGLFRQEFKDCIQMEYKNPWIEEKSWLIDTKKEYNVSFADFDVNAKLYDILVTGYSGKTNRLHLFDIDSVDESLCKNGIDFDKTKIKNNLTLFLYPDDSDEQGRLLRVYQQYFMVSAGAKLLIEEAKKRGSNLHDLSEYVAIQINDTHPSMVIPELIRLLTEEGIDFDEAVAIVTACCAYTNHTILAEALEKWPVAYIEKVAPQIMPVIRRLNDIVTEKYNNSSVAIIIDENVCMAHMDIHFSHSVNGVAYLHTEILKNTELNEFYKLYPEKFNNKTNGITFRRWLIHCNKDLASLITNTIGDEYKKDATKLTKLLDYQNDKKFLSKLIKIKKKNKLRLSKYIKNTMNIKIDTNSIFDIQVKRLHEYKRQQLNILYAIYKYHQIKAGNIPKKPITMIFGAKAAPAYTIAKDIIHLILCMQKLIENDKKVRKHLRIVMVENYNVSFAQKLIPACDISEQISLASKEASGTGNMKFMLNGAVTLGTEDGANVEIHELVGDDNIYIFGEDADTVIQRYERGDYCSRDYYEKNSSLKNAVDFIVSEQLLEIGKKENLERLYNELLNKDWFMTFPDFDEYVLTKEKAFEDYLDEQSFAKKALINIAKSGFFSSDRTIKQYNDEIWKLGE